LWAKCRVLNVKVGGTYSWALRHLVSTDYMWLHIRGVGEWTNRLYNYFECEQEKLHSVEEQLAGNRQLATNVTPEPKGIRRLQAYV
jgi:hypothetical protein